eukprot:5406841-Pyramimonas_sp.AAC.1
MEKRQMVLVYPVVALLLVHSPRQHVDEVPQVAAVVGSRSRRWLRRGLTRWWSLSSLGVWGLASDSMAPVVFTVPVATVCRKFSEFSMLFGL